MYFVQQPLFTAQQPPSGLGFPHYWSFTITLIKNTTVEGTSLDEGSARCRYLYLKTHNTQNRQISIPLAGFEPAFPVSKRPQTHALDRSATAIGTTTITNKNYFPKQH